MKDEMERVSSVGKSKEIGLDWIRSARGQWGLLEASFISDLIGSDLTPFDSV